MKNFCKIVFYLFFGFILNSNRVVVDSHSNSGGQLVGNGGDPLNLIFSKAKVDAYYISSSIQHSDVEQIQDVKIKNFLQKSNNGKFVFELLPYDIQKSLHVWIEDDALVQPTCARTNIPSTSLMMTDIRLSYPLCRDTIELLGQEFAIKLLLHEATHHFGLGGSAEDENLGYDIANKIYEIWDFKRQENEIYWKSIPLRGAPPARSYHSSMKFNQNGEEQIFIWGGCNYSKLPDRESCEKFLQDGFIYNSAQQNWKVVTQSDVPIGRKFAEIVKIGKNLSQQFVIWGGCRSSNDASCQEFLNDGGIYSPWLDRWKPIPSQISIIGRIEHSFISIGNEVILWGGRTSDQKALNDGYRGFFDSTGIWHWQALSGLNAPSPRFGQTSIWTGKEMIVFGGCGQAGIFNCTQLLTDAHAYNPQTDSWRTLPTIDWEFQGRLNQGSVWTGRYMVIWGGNSKINQPLQDGVIFDSKYEEWIPISDLLPGTETGRYNHRLTWNGKSIFMFGGGKDESHFFQSILELSWIGDDISNHSWNTIESKLSPIGRRGHTQEWINDRLFIWGGFSANQTYLPTGATLIQ